MTDDIHNDTDDDLIDTPEELADAIDAGDTLAEELGDHTEYEMIGWGGEQRKMLAGMLTLNDIPHTWQGSTLVVRSEDEERVEPLLEEVNATLEGGLDESQPRVVYAVGEWPAALQSSLAESLGIAEIPFEWDENGDLVIYEADEAHVEEILDAMPDPDDPDTVEGYGVDVQAVLSAIWESTRTLAKKPRDSAATVAFLDNATTISNLSLPFGFDGAVWRTMVGNIMALADRLEAETDDVLSDDEVADAAADISAEVRPFV